MKPNELLGTVVTLNGDPWAIVDVAPAEPLAEMVAAILEEEGMVAVVRGADPLDDVYSHLGGSRVGTTVVLVPQADAERALALIAETVTDYQGDELAELLASGELEVDEIAEVFGDEADEPEDDDDDPAARDPLDA